MVEDASISSASKIQCLGTGSRLTGMSSGKLGLIRISKSTQLTQINRDQKEEPEHGPRLKQVDQRADVIQIFRTD